MADFFDIILRCFNFLFTSISFGSIWFFELIGFLRRSYSSLLDILSAILGVYPFLFPSWWQELWVSFLFFLLTICTNDVHRFFVLPPRSRSRFVSILGLPLDFEFVVGRVC